MYLLENKRYAFCGYCRRALVFIDVFAEVQQQKIWLMVDFQAT
jgi:hypothetical protein